MEARQAPTGFATNCFAPALCARCQGQMCARAEKLACSRCGWEPKDPEGKSYDAIPGGQPRVKQDVAEKAVPEQPKAEDHPKADEAEHEDGHRKRRR